MIFGIIAIALPITVIEQFRHHLREDGAAQGEPEVEAGEDEDDEDDEDDDNAESEEDGLWPKGGSERQSRWRTHQAGEMNNTSSRAR